MNPIESRTARLVGQAGAPGAPAAAPLAVAAEVRAPRPATALAILGYLLVALPICFLGLGSTDAVTMEGIVADGAGHMQRTGDYAVPRLHGEIYGYKPPLAYWLALASFQVFGEETEWTLRFPFALSGLLMGLAVVVLASPIAGPRTAILCGFAAITGTLTVHKLQMAEFDMPLAAGVGIAAAVACRNLCGGRPRGGLWLLGYLALALGFLSKGAPALMFYVPGLALAAWSTRRLRHLTRLSHLAGVLLFGLVVAWWLGSAYLAEGWNAFAQPFDEALDKGLSWDLASAAATVAKPFEAWTVFLPWTLLLPASLSRRWSSERSRRMAVAAASFFAAGVTVFMLVPAAEARYLLPLAAPVGLLCGLSAEQVLGAGDKVRRRVIEVFVLLVGLAAVATAVIAGPEETVGRWLVTSLVVMTVAVVAGSRLEKPGSRQILLLAAFACVGWLAHAQIIAAYRSGSRSQRAVAAAFEPHLGSAAKIWTGPASKDFRHSSLFFYLRRPVLTLAPDGSGPKDGDYLVLFSDEHRQLIAELPQDREVVELGFHRGDELLLARFASATATAGPR